jgi:enterobactin synthetase component D
MIFQLLHIDGLSIGLIPAATPIDQTLFLSKGNLQEWEDSIRFKHDTRRKEFLAGRFIAHSLTPSLNSIGRSDKGLPIWPKGTTGSISHKDGHAIAAVSSKESIIGLGIDIENQQTMKLELAPHICTAEEEKEFLEPFLNQAKQEHLSLIFSAKESLFKCLYPITQQWFGFKDAKITKLIEEEQSFEISLLKNLSDIYYAGYVIKGSYRSLTIENQLYVITSIVVTTS